MTEEIKDLATHPYGNRLSKNWMDEVTSETKEIERQASLAAKRDEVIKGLAVDFRKKFPQDKWQGIKKNETNEKLTEEAYKWVKGKAGQIEAAQNTTDKQKCTWILERAGLVDTYYIPIMEMFDKDTGVTLPVDGERSEVGKQVEKDLDIKKELKQDDTIKKAEIKKKAQDGIEELVKVGDFVELMEPKSFKVEQISESAAKISVWVTPEEIKKVM